MSGIGQLIVLTNIDENNEAEFNRWYDDEHMKERVEIPGFLNARRYMAKGKARWKYLAMYDTEALSVFRSDIYFQKLSFQSDWSKRIQGLFVQPQRNVAERTALRGYGIGAELDFIMVRPAPGQENRARDAVTAFIADDALRTPSQIKLSLFEADGDLSGPAPDYQKVDDSPIERTDWFVVVDRKAGWPVDDDLPGALKGLAGVEKVEDFGRYVLTWALTNHEIAQSA